MDGDVLIIGGGLSGLSAGASLARKGFRVIVLEQHYIPGGCATTFKRKDFVMEAGLHAMDGHLIDESRHPSLLRYLGVRRRLEFLPVPEFFQFRTSRLNFTFPHGTEAAIRSLEEEFPGEKRAIHRFFNLILGIQEELSALPRKNWKLVLGAVLFPFRFPKLTLNVRRTVGSYLDRITDNEDLKLILLGNLLYYHDDPYSLSLLFFAKAQASFIHYGGYFIKGGSQQLSNALADVIRENGGQILLGTKAEKIILEKGRATGVIARDAFNNAATATELRAPYLIHSGALPLLPGLLSGKARSLIQRRIRGMEASTSLFCLYLGFGKEIADLTGGHYSTFMIDEHVKSQGELRTSFQGAWENRSYVFVDYSRVDSGLAPPGKVFGVICTADHISEWEGLDAEEYHEKKEGVAQIMLKRLEKAIPGISERIEYMEAATARTISRYTLNPVGAPYGFAQTPGQAGTNRPGSRSPVKNLFLAGNWTFPGGGFTGAIVSGMLAAGKVSEKLKKGKRGSAGQGRADPRRVPLVESRNVAENTLELRIKKPEGFAFMPGQYVHLSLCDCGEMPLDMPLRTLSIASHPEEADLRFIMRESASPFKGTCAALGKGDEVMVFGPGGEFGLSGEGRDPVFLAAGIGISPVLPMIRELEIRKFRGRVTLLYSNRREDLAAFHADLEKVKLPAWDYRPVYTSVRERIGKHDISLLEDYSHRAYYIVGGSTFLASMKHILGELGIPASQIYTDDFG